MFSTADTALDLRLLEGGFLLLYGARLILLAEFPICAELKDDVLAHGCGVCGWTGGLALLLAKFAPALAFSYPRVYDVPDGGFADASGGFYFAASFVYSIGNDGLCAVLVLGD